MAILNVEDDAAARFLRSPRAGARGIHRPRGEHGGRGPCVGLAQPPKLLLLDVALPDSDGFSVCERFKAAHPEVPVVLITSVYQNAASRRDGFAVGADEYLLTPVEPEHLVETVSKFLAPSAIVATTPPATVVTNDDGRIVYLNAPAGRLLNLTPRGARVRSLLVFFDEGRGRVATRMDRAARGHIEQFTARVQPKEGKDEGAVLQTARQRAPRAGPWQQRRRCCLAEDRTIARWRMTLGSGALPMRLLRTPEPLDHPEFVFEPKSDGFRALARVCGHRCELLSRDGHVFKSWAQLAEEIALSLEEA